MVARCSAKKFSQKIHKEIPVLQSLSDTIKELQAVKLATLLKRHPYSGILNFIIKETTAKMFFCEFCKIFKDIFSFDRTPQDDCFLCLSVNFEFFRTLLS